MSFLQMSLHGAVMIAVITILRALTLNQVPKKTFLVLWALALVRLQGRKPGNAGHFFGIGRTAALVQRQVLGHGLHYSKDISKRHAPFLGRTQGLSEGVNL